MRVSKCHCTIESELRCHPLSSRNKIKEQDLRNFEDYIETKYHIIGSEHLGEHD